MARLKTVYILYSAPWGLACSLINDSRVVSKTHAKRAAAIDSCLPLTLKMPDTAAVPQTRRAPHRMCGVFRPSHGWRVGKSREKSNRQVSFVGGAPFLLVTFLWAPSKKSNSPTEKAFNESDDESSAATAQHQRCSSPETGRWFRQVVQSGTRLHHAPRSQPLAGDRRGTALRRSGLRSIRNSRHAPRTPESRPCS